ncbi:class II D-tagatose-bisphosphate aldolase non-catalytic subunit [Dysgonomonas sp. BGC7]|uniref:class II D-tagatose-bisphosphate aldolase non-catalytic subunit n=1 Tax=Dysgonomonas sp. BGC7 TaxID=1658008 RepID=UPI000680B10E|nr:class II D-tagatose-bisphosphate aldolase, non-catalytic subunit [Dysgonomonas sp. BGC7]MBD8388572.1 class II D-tagatose-bisphosphate aldolase, non-catalytic subunit [Dysgonomonas sp. BGC7]
MASKDIVTKAKTEKILQIIKESESKTGVKRTLLAVCPNSLSVIKAAFRAAKRNNAPIKFAATLNQVDGDGGYTGLTQYEFTKMLQIEAASVNYTGPYIVAVDHGGPWLKDVQSIEKWDTEKAMNGVKKSLVDSIAAGYDLLHVDPTVDIFVADGEIIDIKIVAKRTVELIKYVEDFRRNHNLPPISYEVGTEEVHGGLADDDTFDLFISLLKEGLTKEGMADVWPCFIVGKVGTDLHTTLFDKDVAKKLTEKVKTFGSYIKGHYTDGVTNPEDYPRTGMGAANVGPEFTISEYNALIELEKIEKQLQAEGKVALLSNMKNTLWQLVLDSNRWIKWLQNDEKGKKFEELSEDRQNWLIQTGCRYIWQHPQALAARYRLYENLNKSGINAEEVVLGRIEHDMDKYFYAFNLVNLNDYIS